MKKVLLALLLAVSVTPIASVSADTQSREITGNGSGGDSGNIGGGETTPPTNPNPDQGQGGETTPPTNPNPDQGQGEQKPPVKPEQPKPTPVVTYGIKDGHKTAIILKQAEVATTDLVGAFGAVGYKLTDNKDGSKPTETPAPVTASAVSADQPLTAQTVTLSVGEGAAITTVEVKLTVVPDTYTVSTDKGLALFADKALTLTQTEAQAFNSKVPELATRLNANAINANAEKLPVSIIEDTNLANVIKGTPGTWNVQLSTKKTNPQTRAGEPADTFAVTAAITVTNENQAVLPEADTTGSIKPEEAATQTGNTMTAAGTMGATVAKGVRTGANTNIVALATTVLVAASLIFVVRRTRK